MSCQLWVLELLLSQDKVEDELIKSYVDILPYTVPEGMPVAIQARLMLRVLQGSTSNIMEGSLNALNTLTAFSQESPENYAPYTRLPELSPDFELYLQVKTELVLRPLRENNNAEFRTLLDKYFPADGQNTIPEQETARRTELLKAADDEAEAKSLTEKYTAVALRDSLEAFLKQAWDALGPPFLKVVENDLASGRYAPFQGPYGKMQAASAGAPAVAGQKHQREEGAEAQGARALQDLHCLDGEQNLDQASEYPEGYQPKEGQTLNWDGTEGTPNPPAKKPRKSAAKGGAATDGSPDGPASGKNKTGGPRRKVGRWNEEETNLLLRLTREIGKGKWKKILEEGGVGFKERSQVDLKDKWRNLERQGVITATEGTAEGTPGQGTPQAPPMPMEAINGQGQEPIQQIQQQVQQPMSADDLLAEPAALQGIP